MLDSHGQNVDNASLDKRIHLAMLQDRAFIAQLPHSEYIPGRDVCCDPPKPYSKPRGHIPLLGDLFEGP